MWNQSVVCLIFLSFMLGTCEFIMIGILPDLSEDLSVSLPQAGMLISYFAMAYALGTPLISVFASRFIRYRFMIWMTLLFIAANGITIWISNYTLLLILRVFLAVISGALISVSMTFAPDIAPRRYLPSVVSWIFAGFSIAAVIGVPLGTLAAQIISWRWIFLAIALLSAADLFFMLHALPRTEKTRNSHTSFDEQLRLLTDRRVMMTMGVIFFTAAGNYCWYAYLTPLLEQGLHLPGSWTSAVFFLFGCATILSNLLSGRVAAAGGMLTLAPVLGVNALILAVLPFSLNYPAAGVFIILLLGVFLYMLNASVQIHILRISSVSYPGTGIMAGASNPTAFNAGIALGTALGSLTVEHTGIAYTAFPGVLLICTGTLLCYWLMRPERIRLSRISFRS